MCVICRGRFPKESLTRYVRPLPGGEGAEPNGLLADPGQILPGRGAYVCENESCREKFARFRAKRKKGSGG